MTTSKVRGNNPTGRFLPYFQAIADIQDKNSTSSKGNGFTIQRIFGGANNAIFKITTEAETLACKLCVEDERRRAQREYGALETIWKAGYEIAPRPIWLDDSKSILKYPAVIYHWVEGANLQTPLSEWQLEKFLASYHLLHSIRPSNQSGFQFNAWFHWFNFGAYLQEIQDLAERFAPWLAVQQPDGKLLVARLEACYQACKGIVEKSSVSPKQNHIPLRLMRVDPNLANAIQGVDNLIQWIDWEYSGWGDPALDIAELRWHAALQSLGNESLQWLRTNYKPSFDDPEFGERMFVWDHILATRWPFLILRALWSNHNGPDRERLSKANISSQQYYQRLNDYLDLAEALYQGDNW